jgi:hypothetical protein
MNSIPFVLFTVVVVVVVVGFTVPNDATVNIGRSRTAWNGPWSLLDRCGII